MSATPTTMIHVRPIDPNGIDSDGRRIAVGPFRPVPYYVDPTRCAHEQSMCPDCRDQWERDYDLAR